MRYNKSILKLISLFIIFYFLKPNQTFCQNKQIDSLKLIISKSKEDSNKVNNLLSLSKCFFSIDPFVTIKYCGEAKALSDKLNYSKGLALSFKNIGIAYYMQSNYYEAIQNWNKSLVYFKELGDKAGQANILSNLAVIFFNQADDEKSIEYSLKSLKLAEELNDSLRIATVLSNIGTVYLHKKSTYDKALDYFLRSLPICEKLQDQATLGTVYVNLGEIYYEKEELDLSLSYLQKSIVVYKESENIPYSYIYLGKVFTKKGDFESAIKNENLALEIAKKLNGKLDMARAFLALGNTYKQKGEIKKAVDYYQKGIDIATEIKATIELKDLYQGISSSYSMLTDYNNAFKYQTLLLGIKDTIYNNETDKKLGSMMFNFEIEKKEGQINLLTKDKKIQDQVIQRQKMIRNTFIIGFAIVIIFAGIFLKQRNSITKEKNRSDELLLNILPEETAEELKNTGTATAKSYDSVTVLFTDFKDFTKLSEVLTPKELVAEINECFSAFDAIMQEFGVEKIKTIGDAYMAAGGIPTANNSHPKDVVRAAIAIKNFMDEHKIKKEAKGELFFRIRIGVHTGPVVTGIVGTKKFAYDIWGDTVNTASRLESSGETGKVNVSETTYNLIKNDFHCVHRGKLAAKNKGEINMYFVDNQIVI